MLLGVAYVEGARRCRRIRERDWHTMYPGSCPLGGGSLRPAVNPVYDHRLVYMGAAVGGGRLDLMRDVGEDAPWGCPWWLYICSHLGFTSALMGFVLESPSWASSRRRLSWSSVRQSPYWASRPALGLASVGSIQLANPLCGYTPIGIPPSVVPERVVDS